MSHCRTRHTFRSTANGDLTGSLTAHIEPPYTLAACASVDYIVTAYIELLHAYVSTDLNRE